MKKSTWVGLAWSDADLTQGTDMWQIDGENFIAYDKISSGQGYAQSSTDGSQDLDYTFTDIGNDLLEVVIKRDLDTSDGQDYLLETGVEFDIGWAIKTTNAFLF